MGLFFSGNYDEEIKNFSYYGIRVIWLQTYRQTYRQFFLLATVISNKVVNWTQNLSTFLEFAIILFFFFFKATIFVLLLYSYICFIWCLFILLHGINVTDFQSRSFYNLTYKVFPIINVVILLLLIYLIYLFFALKSIIMLDYAIFVWVYSYARKLLTSVCLLNVELWKSISK